MSHKVVLKNKAGHEIELILEELNGGRFILLKQTCKTPLSERAGINSESMAVAKRQTKPIKNNIVK